MGAEEDHVFLIRKKKRGEKESGESKVIAREKRRDPGRQGKNVYGWLKRGGLGLYLASRKRARKLGGASVYPANRRQPGDLTVRKEGGRGNLVHLPSTKREEGVRTPTRSGNSWWHRESVRQNAQCSRESKLEEREDPSESIMLGDHPRRRKGRLRPQESAYVGGGNLQIVYLSQQNPIRGFTKGEGGIKEVQRGGKRRFACAEA